MTPQLRRLVLDHATAPYFSTGRFNYHWSRGKLGRDPIFPAIVDLGLLPDGARVLDLGCGRGLLAAWLLAAERVALDGHWPAGTPQPPRGLRFRGIELIRREVECGNHALRAFGERAHLEQGDLRAAGMAGIDAVAILDVLHYVDYHAQDAALDRIRAALPPGGVFLTRVGDAAAGLPFHLSRLADHCLAFAQGHRLPRLWCRPLHDWALALRQRGFAVETRPMSRGTPFANVMVVARAD